MELAAIIISILALIVSIFSPIIEYLLNKRLNEYNLTSEYFRSIYGNIIYEDIPKYREYVHFDGEKITGTDELISTLKTLRIKSIYFKRANKDFYTKLVQDLQSLEDHLVTCPTSLTDDQFVKFHTKMNECLDEIYSDIFNGFIGKKMK